MPKATLRPSCFSLQCFPYCLLRAELYPCVFPKSSQYSLGTCTAPDFRGVSPHSPDLHRPINVIPSNTKCAKPTVRRDVEFRIRGLRLRTTYRSSGWQPYESIGSMSHPRRSRLENIADPTPDLFGKHTRSRVRLLRMSASSRSTCSDVHTILADNLSADSGQVGLSPTPVALRLVRRIAKILTKSFRPRSRWSRRTRSKLVKDRRQPADTPLFRVRSRIVCKKEHSTHNREPADFFRRGNLIVSYRYVEVISPIPPRCVPPKRFAGLWRRRQLSHHLTIVRSISGNCT